MAKLRSLIAEKRLSLWIGGMVLLLCCTMMQPSFAALITGVIILILLIILRKVAHIEGRITNKLPTSETRITQINPPK